MLDVLPACIGVKIIGNLCSGCFNCNIFRLFPWISFIDEVDWGFYVRVVPKSPSQVLGWALERIENTPLSETSITHCLQVRRSFALLGVISFSFIFSRSLGLADFLRFSFALFRYTWSFTRFSKVVVLFNIANS